MPDVSGVSQEEKRYESSPVKVPPPSRRRMPSTPQQNSRSSIEERQWQIEMDQIWNARDRTVFARMEQYSGKSDSMKVEVEELKSLLGPEDSEVDFRRILGSEEQKGSRDL